MIFPHYTTLPHNLIKDKLKALTEWSFQKGLSYLVCNERNALFTSEHQTRYKLWSCQNKFEALTYLLDDISVGVMRQSAYLIIDPITVENFAFLVNCKPVGRASDSILGPT